MDKIIPLTSRSQSVVVEGENSDFVSVTSGDLYWGQYYSLYIYINDLPNYTRHSNVRLFADDTVIYLTITSTQDANKLQYDLNRLESWAREWLMDFNLDKTYVLRFSRKKNKTTTSYFLQDRILEEVDSVKYLGVTITQTIDWKKHIEKTVAKGKRTLGFLKRNLKMNLPKLKDKAYKAFVRPTLEYCSSVWDTPVQGLSQRIEMVQHRAARWVLGRNEYSLSITHMLKKLGWRPLAQRRADARLYLLHEIVHGLVHIDKRKYVKMQRDEIKIQPIYARTIYYENGYLRIVRNWNCLPNQILSTMSIELFKSRVSQITHVLD